MAETALITVDDVKEFRNISKRWNDKDERFLSYVNEAQRINLRELLGQSLYKDLFDKFPDGGIYDDLVNGTTYTYDADEIDYLGLKPFICYHWLALAVREDDLFMAIYGNVNFVNNPDQNFVPAKDKEKAAERFIENANVYRNDIVQFLNEKNSVYTLYDGGRKINKTSWQIQSI